MNNDRGMATNQSLKGIENKVSGFPSDTYKVPTKRLKSVAIVNAIGFSVTMPRLRKSPRRTGEAKIAINSHPNSRFMVCTF